MSRAEPKEQKKWEMNSEPWSQVMCARALCLETSWMMKFGALISSTVGMNMPCFVRRSTMTKIAVCSSDSGRYSMKSMEIEFHGNSGTGSCFNKP